MTLPTKRVGEELEFHMHPYEDNEVTLGDPEKLIWSSINHLCAFDITDALLYKIYNVRNKQIRTAVAESVKIYIKQAFEFYETAKISKANTAPLYFYYSFLNLGKALCEIKFHNFHKRDENYWHGISWKPSPKYRNGYENCIRFYNKEGCLACNVGIDC